MTIWVYLPTGLRCITDVQYVKVVPDLDQAVEVHTGAFKVDLIDLVFAQGDEVLIEQIQARGPLRTFSVTVERGVTDAK